MLNAKGDLVHIKNVKEIDKLRDEFVRDLIPPAIKIRDDLACFKESALSQIEAFVEMAANDHGETFGGKKGNFKLDSYDGKYRVQVSISDDYTHNEQLLVGKKKIDDCLREWGERSPPQLQTAVNHTFSVDKEGKYNYRKIMEMRQWDIPDNKWIEALKVALDGIVPCGTKSYLRFYKRVGKENKFQQIPLNFTAL